MPRVDTWCALKDHSRDTPWTGCASTRRAILYTVYTSAKLLVSLSQWVARSLQPAPSTQSCRCHPCPNYPQLAPDTGTQTHADRCFYYAHSQTVIASVGRVLPHRKHPSLTQKVINQRGQTSYPVKVHVRLAELIYLPHRGNALD